MAAYLCVSVLASSTYVCRLYLDGMHGFPHRHAHKHACAHTNTHTPNLTSRPWVRHYMWSALCWVVAHRNQAQSSKCFWFVSGKQQLRFWHLFFFFLLKIQNKNKTCLPTRCMFIYLFKGSRQISTLCWYLMGEHCIAAMSLLSHALIACHNKPISSIYFMYFDKYVCFERLFMINRFLFYFFYFKEAQFLVAVS